MAARLCAICSAALAGRTAFRLPYVKYSTGTNETTCTAYRALGKPNQTAARRAFLEGRAIGEWHAESKCLFRRDSAIWRPAVFSSISFLPRQKRYGPRSGGDGAPNQTAPSAHSNAGLKPPLRKHKAAKALLTNGAAPSRARLLLSYRSTFSKRSADVWKASVLSSSQTAAPPSRTGSCRSWSCRA